MDAVVHDKIGTTEMGFGHSVATPLTIWKANDNMQTLQIHKGDLG